MFLNYRIASTEALTDHLIDVSECLHFCQAHLLVFSHGFLTLTLWELKQSWIWKRLLSQFPKETFVWRYKEEALKSVLRPMSLDLAGSGSQSSCWVEVPCLNSNYLLIWQCLSFYFFPPVLWGDKADVGLRSTRQPASVNPSSQSRAESGSLQLPLFAPVPPCIQGEDEKRGFLGPWDLMSARVTQTPSSCWKRLGGGNPWGPEKKIWSLF